MCKIGRAVERVDDPFPRIVAADYDGIARFLGEDRVFRIIRFDPLDDQGLGSKIGVGDEIDISFF